MSNIWDDAGAIRPVLDQTKLAAYLKRDEGFLDAEDLKEGLTPLARALLSGNVKTVTLLLRNKANFDKKVRDGRTPMYLAADAAQGRRRMIQLLLEKNPATFDEEGPSFVQNNTPLMAAVKRDDPEAVKLLVERGASKEKKNSAGKTARDLVDESKPNSANVKKALGFNPSKGLAYQPIIFCDDSGSMWSEDNGPGTYEGDRWESQIELVKSISSATTRAIPSDTGCHLRFINRDTPEYNNLDETAIGNILNKYDRGNGWTPIGTKLREHVFDQLIYPDLESGKLIKRPFLVICITDGFPTQERAMKGAPVGKEDQNRNQDADRFRKEIRELQKVLDAKGYRDEVAQFSIIQIGNITDWEDKAEADKFWDGLKSDDKIGDVLYVIDDASHFHDWLRAMLHSPLPSLLY